MVWQTLCKLCLPLGSPAMRADYCFLPSQSCGPTGWLVLLLIKVGDVKTNPGPTNTRKEVSICDICHRQIQVRKTILIRCNRIEHWLHLRCAGIRLAQYTDSWTCRQHKESRPQHPPRPWLKLPTNIPHFPPPTPSPQHHPHRNQNTHTYPTFPLFLQDW